MNTQQFRVRLSPEDSEVIRELAESSSLMPGDIVAMLMHGATQAVRRKKDDLNFPIKFEVKDKNCTCARAS